MGSSARTIAGARRNVAPGKDIADRRDGVVGASADLGDPSPAVAATWAPARFMASPGAMPARRARPCAPAVGPQRAG
jgi:hypothetical protein